MKEMNYKAPQIEVVRFEMEEILAGAIISGTKMDENVPEVGGTNFQIP